MQNQSSFPFTLQGVRHLTEVETKLFDQLDIGNEICFVPIDHDC